MKKMKKISTLVLAGVLVASSVMPVFGANAAELTKANSKMEVAVNESNIDKDMLMSMETYIKSLTFLSEKINQAFKAIKLYEKYEALETKNEAIWEKLYKQVGKNEFGMDETALIKSSKALTNQEKNTLLKELEALKKLDKVAEAKEKEVLAKEKTLVAQAKKLEQEIEAMNAKNQAIWDKVTKDARANGKTDDPSVIPYKK